MLDEWRKSILVSIFKNKKNSKVVQIMVALTDKSYNKVMRNSDEQRLKKKISILKN